MSSVEPPLGKKKARTPRKERGKERHPQSRSRVNRRSPPGARPPKAQEARQQRRVVKRAPPAEEGRKPRRTPAQEAVKEAVNVSPFSHTKSGRESEEERELECEASLTARDGRGGKMHQLRKRKGNR